MTARWTRGIALAAAAAASLTWGGIGGVPLTRTAIALIVVIATGVVASRWPRPIQQTPPASRTGRVAPPHGYPTYEAIEHKLSWAATSPTYTERVLQPWLVDLARDLGVPGPAADLSVAEATTWLEQALADQESAGAAR